MESQLSIAVLCFLGLSLSIQVLSLETENLAKYEKCWAYDNCLSDFPQTINGFCNILRPEDIEALYRSIQDYYKCQSKTFYDGIKEYCKIADDEKVSFLNSC
ncbi:hypothetical protein AVEN_202548-1 [Araneus ventricosus]|uniref:Saposin B-type domain-containing protein n=1 Tax=Araneus ventricosus TaxID=182803 RepID=A0A4Y2IQV1_ARAVE|nr:hypothetical protein AVEN_202548-1 [Araneus ventricosus]